MLKKSLLILLLVGTVNNVHGFWPFDSSEETNDVPYSNVKIVDDETLEKALEDLEQMRTYSKSKTTQLKKRTKEQNEIDSQAQQLQASIATLLESINYSECQSKIEDEKQLNTKYAKLLLQKEKSLQQLCQVAASLNALEAEIKCYQKKNTHQEDVPSVMDQQDNNPDEPDVPQKDEMQELKVAVEQKDVQAEVTVEEIKKEEESI